MTVQRASHTYVYVMCIASLLTATQCLMALLPSNEIALRHEYGLLLRCRKSQSYSP